MAVYNYERHFTAAHQYFALKNNRICRGEGRVHRRRLTWEFEAIPTPLSRSYRVRIDYHEDDKPSAFVVSPDLTALAEGRSLPHVYSENPVRPCLYLPGKGEWSSRMLIANTIVPWVYLWFFYFEEWLLTNEWKGGGEHPPKDDHDGRP